MRWLAVILLSLLLLPIMSARSQNPGQLNKTKLEDEEKIKMRVDLVLLDALVMQQKNGRVVGDLKKDDFNLYEDGIKQQITHFSQDSLPISVLLLVDRGGCLDPYSDEMHRATLDALNRLKPTDDVALMTFEENVELVKGFRFDRQAIADVLNNLPEHDEDKEHCFNIALYEAAKYMKKAGNPGGRRVIIVITGITKSFDCNGPSSEEARLALLESGTVVCALVPSSAGQRMENGLMNGITSAGGIFKAKTTSLKQFAEETGGEIFTAKKENLNKAFDDMISHIRTRYSLGFTSTNTKNDGSFRKLKLEVSPEAEKRQGKMVIKTRRGYIASATSSE